MAISEKIPAIGGVPASADPTTRKFMSAVKQRLEIAFGDVGGDGFAGLDQLVQSGALVKDSSGNYTVPKGPGGTTDFTPPPAPTGVEVDGGFATVILSWDSPTYSNPGYAEILRSVDSNIGDAVVIGQTPGNVFADAVGNSFTGYYWVRFVSLANVTGPVDSVAGHQATTSLDPTYAMSVLASVYGNAPFYLQSTPTVINGVAVPAGIYVKDAYIANGTITTAKIGLAMIDNARIASLAVATANIADGAITTAKIGTAQITTALIAQAAIGTANIQNGAITNALIGTAAIGTANIQNGAITNALIGNAQITGAQIATATIATGNIGNGQITNALIGNAQITTANISNGAITNAQISSATIIQANMASASIGNAQIQSASVDSLRLAGRCVTVQAQFTGGGTSGYTSSGGIICVFYSVFVGGTTGTGTNVTPVPGSVSLVLDGAVVETIASSGLSGGNYATGVYFWQPAAGGHTVALSTSGATSGTPKIVLFEAFH